MGHRSRGSSATTARAALRYRELRDSDPLAYFFFSITYIILFKYMIINMFFAIVDKHYHREILSDAYKSLEAEYTSHHSHPASLRGNHSSNTICEIYALFNRGE